MRAMSGLAGIEIQVNFSGCNGCMRAMKGLEGFELQLQFSGCNKHLRAITGCIVDRDLQKTSSGLFLVKTSSQVILLLEIGFLGFLIKY